MYASRSWLVVVVALGAACLVCSVQNPDQTTGAPADASQAPAPAPAAATGGGQQGNPYTERVPSTTIDPTGTNPPKPPPKDRITLVKLYNTNTRKEILGRWYQDWKVRADICCYPLQIGLHLSMLLVLPDLQEKCRQLIKVVFVVVCSNCDYDPIEVPLRIDVRLLFSVKLTPWLALGLLPIIKPSL